MATDLHIRNADKVLVAAKDGTTRYLTGKTVTGSSNTAREIYVHNATKTLRWVDATGVTRQAKGVDIGTSGQPDGGLWVNSSGLLRFAMGGRVYDPHRNTFRNNVAGTVLRVYSNSSRTTLLVSAPATYTATFNGHQGTYYCRLVGANNEQYDFTITAFSGWSYNVNGTYTPGEPEVWDCDCVFKSRGDSGGCSPESIPCASDRSPTGDGSCIYEGNLCSRYCNYVSSGFGYYEVEEYTCKSRKISNGRAAVWSITTAEV